MKRRPGRCLALSGGVGGAKLAVGLSRVVEGDRLIVVANTADDFEHLGLYVAPDVDTVMYNLAGLANPTTGWGRERETWSFLAEDDTMLGEFLDSLTEPAGSSADEIKAFLMQRQSHVLGRADRPWHG